MRNAFIDELVTCAETNEKIVLVVGDLGYGVIEPFIKRFPKRFFNAGIAEQNMMGLSAGLASEGHHVFVYSIGNFPTFRCAEQIRNDVDYHNLPVTIVAVGGGLAYGNLGYSHHAIQDYSLIRGMPNMLIASPGDPMETRACMRYLSNNPQPSYLRLGKAGERNIHKSPPNITPGQWLFVGGDPLEKNIILSTGATLDYAMSRIENSLGPEKYGIYSVPLWGMQFKKLQPEKINKTTSILTIEDHLLDGGFGSWILESMSNETNGLSKIKNLYLDSKICGAVGKQATLNSLGGLA